MSCDILKCSEANISTMLVWWICRKSTTPRVDDFTGASRGRFVVITPAINTPPEFPQASEFQRVHRGGFAANSPRAGHRDNRNYLKLTGGKDPQPILPFPTLPWRQVVRKIVWVARHVRHNTVLDDCFSIKSDHWSLIVLLSLLIKQKIHLHDVVAGGSINYLFSQTWCTHIYNDFPILVWYGKWSFQEATQWWHFNAEEAPNRTPPLGIPVSKIFVSPRLFTSPAPRNPSRNAFVN